ncbi:16S rRNA (guanine(527)-N(7))-methyltransferase RsmG [Pelagibacteraceae bacterium]|mgnify:FL=1|nr:16S rRNA (guanine(527)-N(7))-methyltransferase RsmG [Pelagibacteraceae bacterium]|tara:strand:+ start:16 stop:630 length:615 start_codon:yes stop_codon:yes gene_type:complete
MSEEEAKETLKNILKFTSDDLRCLEIYKNELLSYNSKYNLISRSTEKSIWSRHILDSAQLLKYFNTKNNAKLADFGTGAGFPGIVIAIYNKNPKFHVKLYEKSSVKRDFLNNIKKRLNLNIEIEKNVYSGSINADIIVSRAFKKLAEIISISREIIKKPHRMFILKGKSAQDEINKLSLGQNYSYKLERSITDVDSKIITVEVT